MTRKYTYVGQAAPRRDARDIVTGATRFVADLTMPRLLSARVVRSPHPRARIERVDAGAARALPGVAAVLTHTDVPDWFTGTPRSLRVLGEETRFAGDAVALVAAETEELAARAAALVEVAYEPLPPVLTLDEALAPDAPQPFPEAPGNVVRPGTRWFGPDCLTAVVAGDVELGFAEADVVVEDTYSYENLPNPLPPEPPSAIALWEEPDRVTFWLSSQSPHPDRGSLFVSLGREVDVRVIGMPCGGSYGSKLMATQVYLQAAALSRATGRPVRLCLTKEEHLACYALRIGARLRGRVGMRSDGTVTAIAGDWLIDTGHYSHTTQAQVAVGCGEAQLAVRCENWDLRPTIVCTNRNASGIVRGFGGQELKCCLLPLLGQAMAALDLDPLEFFKRNFVTAGDTYVWRDGRRYTYRGVDYRPAMEAGARAFGWEEKWRGWLRPSSVQGSRRVGVGVALHGNADVGESVSEAYVRLEPSGRATIHATAAEHGTGQANNLCRMVAEVLQVPLDRVTLTPPDTSITPYESGPFGSRGTYAMGSACINAAEAARAELLERAGPLLGGAEPDELDTCDALVYRRDAPDAGVRWGKVLGGDRTIMGFGRFEPDFTLSNCLISFVEVAVDIETGKVDLLRVVNATDAGRIVDPAGLQNQMNGCLGAAGIDSALFEETVLDPATGMTLNANLTDYKWRAFTDLPSIQNVVLETPVESHRFHAIGVGEVATAPGPAAVLMAVSNALGVWLRDYPVTPERVLRALEDTPGTEADRAGA